MIYELGEKSPQFDETAWIAETAVLVGDVRLGKDVGIWYGAILRGDNEPLIIGDNTNIQELAMFHTDMGFPLTIGTGCTIGHKALLHGCIIGNNTLIGMNATVMNGAKIGNNCIIGAGAIVTEGKEIPDGSLVIGAPGKVKREITDQEMSRIKLSAISYVKNKDRFRKDARLI